MKKVILFACFLVLTGQAFAAKCDKEKKEKKTVEAAPVVEEQEEARVVTDECSMNLSLFSEAAKQKNYADALAPWKEVYTDCPFAHRAIYTYGEKILNWQIEKEADAAKKAALVDELLVLFDKQIKYFGTDKKYPEGKVLGKKAYYYILYNESTKVNAYDWLKKSVATMGFASEPAPLQQLMAVSYEKYKQNAEHAEQFINDYLTVLEILDANSKNEALKNRQIYSDLKPAIDLLFVQSGVADCATMDQIFGTKVVENGSNVDYLNSVLRCYRRIKCNESKVFFQASELVHKISPSAESANGCAEMSYKAEKYDDAIAYYDEAIRLASDKLEKADYQFKIAQIYAKMDKYVKAREYARLSLSNNPSDGKPYLLIGSVYAKSKIYDDSVLQKTVYWVAVDKFEQAKRVDPEGCTEDANKLISVYRQYYPSKEEVFMHPDLMAGKSFRVEGWIGENTVCR